MKTCRVCGLNATCTEELSLFKKNKASLLGVEDRCKICHNLAKLEWNRTKAGKICKIYSKQVQSSKRRNMPLPTYSKDELRDWLMASQEFHHIFNLWIISGFDTRLAPSIDRVDPYKSYTFDNIEVMTWNENDIKGRTERKVLKSLKG